MRQSVVTEYVIDYVTQERPEDVAEERSGR